ncbi:DNRLRE domain-containing protein [Corallococcus exiguus]|uniref:CBM96 family carbohydrate-binding protein n=1 Tax=Corallococcus exiguus TaxID=83462 RepID=UPI001A8E6BE6|nr:DNRLRE domain-containing protein [Corallococcus exiguus]MBN8467542.1 DNRLRE domain-containing protein [Corallococcus exiguus]
MTAIAMVMLLPRCGGMTEGPEAETGGAPGVVAQSEAALLPECRPRGMDVARTVVATADGTVRSDQPDANLSGSSTLFVDSVPTRYQSYLLFPLVDQGGTLTRARLRLYAKNGTATGVTVHGTMSGFSEGDLTWNTRPVEGIAVATVPEVATDGWLTAEVKDAVRSHSTLALALKPVGDDGADFSSREASNASRRPMLDTVVRYDWCTYQGPLTGGMDWRRKYGGEGKDALVGLVNLPDGSGFVMGGSYQGTALMGGVRLPAPGGLFVARDDNGANTQWARVYAAGAQVTMHALTATPLGNVLVVGTYEGSPDFGTGPLPYVTPELGGQGLFVLKLSPTGDPVWAHGFRAEKRPGGSPGQVFSAPAVPSSVATDANGSLIVTGRFQGFLDLGGGEIFAGHGSQQDDPTNGLFLAKFDFNGGHLWSQAFEGGEGDDAVALATDANGAIFLGGRSGNPVLASAGAYGNSPFVARFAQDGTPAWGRALKGSTGTIRGLAVLPSGGVAFAGDFNGTFVFQGTSYTSKDPTYDERVDDAVFGTLTGTGADGWVRVFGGDGGGDSARSVAVDGAGNVIVNGTTPLNTFDLGGGPLGTEGLSLFDPLGFLASYGPTGTLRWSRFVGPGVLNTALAVTPSGSTRLGFTFRDTAYVGEQVLTSVGGGESDIGVIQFIP